MSADLHLPQQFAAAEKTLDAACHCQSVRFAVTVPTSVLPLPVHLCHCSICRFTHGTFSAFHAALPNGILPAFVPPSSPESSLTGYVHAAQAATERLFCTTCGCHVGDRDLKPDPDTGTPTWRVATSIFSSHGEDIFQIRSHWFSSAATEPNLATWLPSINSRALHAWNPSPSDPHFPPRTPSPPHNPDPDRPDLLPAQCHCAGVRFALPRPSAEEAADPFLSRFLDAPDTSAPPAGGHGPDGAADPGKASNGTPRRHDPRRRASLCLCRDCRLTTGAHAVAWTPAPLARIIRQPAGSASGPAPGPGSGSGSDSGSGSGSDTPALDGFGTLRTYRSSDKATRAFCRVCGATVLYLADGPEPLASPSEEKRVVDVAVGILRDPRGTVAAEDWLAWRTGGCTGMRSGREFDPGFAEAVVRGLGEWGVKR